MSKARFSKLGFILAAAGSAVGLGSIWKFPFMAGQNGGGIFVLIYILAVFVIAVSLFIAEALIGRFSRLDAVGAFEELAPNNKNIWKYAGFMAFTSAIILSYYTVIIGWTLRYLFHIFITKIETIDQAKLIFSEFVTKSPVEQLFFYTLAFFIISFIIIKGVVAGIERVNKWMMPLLLVILVVLMIYVSTLDGFLDGVKFLLLPDFSKITSNSIFEAVGQAFFSMSIGMAIIITYATSMPKESNLPWATMWVAFLTIAISIIAGLMIFGLIFHFGAEPAQGPGLVFVSMPTLFSALGGVGIVLGVLFFIALIFAGLTSAISILEPAVLYFIVRHKMSRRKATIYVGISVYILGLFSLFSNIDSVSQYLTFFGKSFLDLLDLICSSILLPVGGIVISIFVGFVMPQDRIKSFLIPMMGQNIFKIWLFSVRYVIPTCIVFVIFNKLIQAV